MRVIFMGTPEFAVPTLRALVESAHEVVAVYSQPPRPKGRGLKDALSPIHLLAEEKGLKILTPITLKNSEAQREFAEFAADVAVVVAYGLILPEAILKGTRLGCINIHPSALPRWRGAAPIQRSIMAGDKETEICIMQMDAGLDTGDVLLRKKYQIAADMSAGELNDVLSQESTNLLLETLKQLENKIAKPVPQAEVGVTYAHKITKEECRISWHKTASEINNLIKGLSPTPGAYCMLNGEILKIFAATIRHETSAAKPGEIIDNSLAIACGEGVLIPLKVQRAGKARQTIEEFLRGNPVTPGTILE